jgi:hypothetical protein
MVLMHIADELFHERITALLINHHLEVRKCSIEFPVRQPMQKLVEGSFVAETFSQDFFGYLQVFPR